MDRLEIAGRFHRSDAAAGLSHIELDEYGWKWYRVGASDNTIIERPCTVICCPASTRLFVGG